MRDDLLDGLRCFALDMDGTLWLGEEWLPGAREFLAWLEATGRSYYFLTNNSSKSTAAYGAKLARMGLAVPPERIITSGRATIDHLLAHYPGARVFLMGNESLAGEFRAQGITLTGEDPDLVVTAYDTELTYEKLCRTCALLRRGLPFIATHPDINCPSPQGFLPDIGAFHALLKASTGREPDLVLGKPNPGILAPVLARSGLPPQAVAMVGDRLYTDIAAGKAAGVCSILVLSGETRREDLERSAIRPDLVFDGVAGIMS